MPNPESSSADGVGVRESRSPDIGDEGCRPVVRIRSSPLGLAPALAEPVPPDGQGLGPPTPRRCSPDHGWRSGRGGRPAALPGTAAVSIPPWDGPWRCGGESGGIQSLPRGRHRGFGRRRDHHEEVAGHHDLGMVADQVSQRGFGSGVRTGLCLRRYLPTVRGEIPMVSFRFNSLAMRSLPRLDSLRPSPE